MRIGIHFFARARELAGADRLEVELVVNPTVADLRTELMKRVPPMRELLTVSRIAVNHEFAAEEDRLQESDEVAVIPPVSGG